MAITDPQLLRFVAEGIRPAADRIIGGYDSATTLVLAWDDSQNQLELWPAVQQMSVSLWASLIDTDKILYPWDWTLGVSFPWAATPIDDGHSRPIESQHCHRVVECVRQVQTIALDASEAWGRAIYSTSLYGSEPADTAEMVAVITGLRQVIEYIDDAGNNSNRRIKVRAAAVNPSLYEVV